MIAVAKHFGAPPVRQLRLHISELGHQFDSSPVAKKRVLEEHDEDDEDSLLYN